MQTTRNMATQTRAAVLQPESFNADANTIDVVWTTGAPVRRFDPDANTYYDEVLVVGPDACDLSLLNGGSAPVLDTHNRFSLSGVVGLVEKAWFEGEQGIGTLRLSTADADAAVRQKVQSGIIRQVSVGYRVLAMEIVANDNGIPTYRITKWQPFEISLVPIGADAGAGTRAPENNQTPCIVVTKENDMTVRNNEEPTTGAPAAAVTPPATPAASDPAPGDLAATQPAAALASSEGEAQRAISGEVLTLALRHKLPEDTARKIMANSRTVEQARSLVLAELERHSPSSFAVLDSEHNRTSMDNPQARMAAMSDAVLHRMAPQHFKLEAAARNYGHMSLLRLAEESLIAQGEKVRGLSADQIAARALQTTSDFPALTANVLNKRLRNAYQENSPSYRRWARRAPNAPDFKTIQVTKLSNMPDLMKTNEHGEFKYGKMMDGKESYSVTTYGVILGVTRQLIINDDLRALDRMTTGFANSAARLENRTVYAELTNNAPLSDGVELFHATHNNLNTAAAINVSSLSTGRIGMRKQKGDQGEELNIVPAFLIAPASQEQLAYQFTSSNFVPAKSADVNEFRQGGRTALEPIIESILDASSPLSWYLAASSDQVDTVEYCYLDGSEGVFIDSHPEFGFDGMKLKARLDFAAKAIDFRGLQKNPGA